MKTELSRDSAVLRWINLFRPSCDQLYPKDSCSLFWTLVGASALNLVVFMAILVASGVVLLMVAAPFVTMDIALEFLMCCLWVLAGCVLVKIASNEAWGRPDAGIWKRIHLFKERSPDAPEPIISVLYRSLKDKLCIKIDYV